jgi:PAS domain S-box-containing protein
MRKECCVTAAVSRALPILLLVFEVTALRVGAQARVPPRFDRALTITAAQNSGAMIQDRDGFLWIGTLGQGLIRFDGYEQKVYKAGGINPFPDSTICALYEDRDGLIWVQTGSSGVVSYDKERDAFTAFTHDPADPRSLSSNESAIFAPGTIAESADGLLWIGTQEGLNAFDKRKGGFTRYLHDPADPKSLAGDRVHAVMVDRHDNVWIGMEGSGLDMLDRTSGSFVHYRHDPKDPGSLASDVVYTLLEDRDGIVWAGTDRGLLKLDRDGRVFSRYTHRSGDPNGPASDTIIGLAQDEAGTIWINYLDPKGGLTAFDPPRGAFWTYASNPADPHSPSSDYIIRTMADRSGILWFVNQAGPVDKLDPHASRFLTYPQDTQLNAIISTLFLDSGQNLWISSFPVGLTLRDRATGKFRTYFTDSHYSALMEDGSGNLWMATTLPATLRVLDRGTGRFSKSLSHDPRNPASLSARVMQIGAIVEDAFNPDHLWLATYGAGIERYDRKTGRFTHFPHDPGNADSVSKDNLWMMYKDAEGILWLPTMGGGLDRLDPRTGHYTHYICTATDPATIGSNTVNTVFEDSAGRLWVGTANGFDMLDRATGRFTRYSPATGFPVSGILSIQEDGQGTLWMGSNNGDGLIRFDPRTREMKVFRGSDGLPGDSFVRGAVRDASGRMWFGSYKGLVSFLPGEVGANRSIPPVKITALKQGGEPLALGKAPERLESLSLDWQHNYFEFEYAALSYTNPSENRYRYMLDGLDKGWYDAGTSRFGRYSGLQGGVYTLRIVASNNDGIWNEKGVALRLHVNAPWWQAWWFYALMAALAIGLALTAYLYRGRQLRMVRIATENLRESRERYRSLVENLGEGIMTVDPQEKIVFANPMAATILEGTATDITGRDLREYLSPQGCATILMETEKRRRGEKSHYEIEIIRPDGTVRRVQMVVTPQQDSEGSFVGAFTLMLDLTEMRKTEEALMKAKEELEQARKLEAVGKLAGGIAHDFNNILTVIEGYADLIETGLPESNPLKRDVNEIRTAAGRATSLTAQLLAFSRKQVLRPRVISVNQVVRGVQNMLARLVGEDVMLKTVLPPEAGNILADPVQIEQVMMNLAANARDAMPDGGTLTMESANCVFDAASAQMHPEVAAGEYVMLAVSDTGQGMDRTTLSRVFEPFFTTKEMGKGTGLGLATVYGIVKQSGGYIFSYSEKGMGTTFRLYFPRVHENGTVEAPRTAGAKPLLGTETVLLVEDERAIRNFVGIALRHAGYSVREVQNGLEAIAEVSSSPGHIHLLLTDVAMPGMNGPELVRRIREIHPGVRVLYMSGYTADSIVHKGILDAGIDMIEKPFNGGRLLEKVREVLDR